MSMDQRPLDPRVVPLVSIVGDDITSTRIAELTRLALHRHPDGVRLEVDGGADFVAVVLDHAQHLPDAHRVSFGWLMAHVHGIDPTDARALIAEAEARARMFWYGEKLGVRVGLTLAERVAADIRTFRVCRATRWTRRAPTGWRAPGSRTPPEAA